MSELKNNGSKTVVRLIEFAVLCVAFYITCQLLEVDTSKSLFAEMALYSTVVMLSIILSQRWLCAYKAIGEVSRYILADAAGILVGTCAVLTLQSVIST